MRPADLGDGIAAIVRESIRDVDAAGADPPAIFDEVERRIVARRNTPCHSLSDLRRTRCTKTTGDLWEALCARVLPLRFDDVERACLLADVPSAELERLGLRRADRGIDAIAWYRDGSVAAVQCKFRSDRRAISWASLATFYALAARTGPYRKHVVMTNGRGVRREGRRGARDWSVCRGTFRSIPRRVWETIAGCAPGRVLGGNAPASDDAESLRRLRLARFDTSGGGVTHVLA